MDATVQEAEIIDPLGPDDEVQPAEYRITSYGADYPVELLVSRLQKDELYTPPFQRGFVWDIKMASRFVESLLLGLPVPGIFLSKEPEQETHLIIDGQQRLKTLQFFVEGIFRPRDKTFALEGVDKRFRGRTFRTLEDPARRRLMDGIIHATIVRQDDPAEDQSSIYHIFERLNSGGRQLAPQEIRSALFHGPLVSLLDELNSDVNWRAIYGSRSSQQRDQELVVRFLAFYFFGQDYSSPMKVFLNRYMGRNRGLAAQGADEIRKAFQPTIDLAFAAFGARAFKPQRALNAAVFDSVMVALAKRLEKGPVGDLEELRETYEALLADETFLGGTVRATANEKRVAQRFKAAEGAFADVP
jgi:hypothetical protein